MSAQLRVSSVAEAPAGTPPAALLWSYAGLFGAPAAYRVLDGERPVAWLCGVGGGARRRFDALPERLYGLVPDGEATVDLDALGAALARTGVAAEVTCAPLGRYVAADLAAYHRLDTFLVHGAAPGEAEPKLARVGRQGVRKAQQAGVTVRRAPLADALDEYHAIYADKCARHDAPAKPREFFARLAAAFAGAGGGAELFFGDHAGRAVAAALVVRAGRYAIFADGSSRQGAWALCPNNLVVWTAARALLEEGAAVLDYGLSAAGDGGDARFKAHLGGARTPVYVVTA
ncbi:MAG TPA: GNAT family N-acetyltransferase [Polyangia bacterium]